MAARLTLAIVLLCLTGCATCPNVPSRRFEFARDRFAFRNELLWAYSPTGETQKIEPPPEYALHCFPMVRAAREFFYHAHFNPELPKVSAAEYRRLVREVVGRDSRFSSVREEKIVIPGYSGLFDFSAEHQAILKAECGSKIASYTQRGHWRMIFPFSRRHQVKTARTLEARIDEGFAPIIHIVDFPRLKINHALLLIGKEATQEELMFLAYDPNNSTQPAVIRYSPREQTFFFEKNNYFHGGPVDVYEVYSGILY